jgi:hypothetical protein
MMKKYLCTVLLFSSGLLPYKGYAQVVINEISNANVSNFFTPQGKTEDWIELYNSGSSSVNLQGYALSDGGGDKWYFPNTSIAPYSFKIIVASGDDVYSGGLYHTDFKIGNDEKTIMLYDVSGQVVDECIRVHNLQVNHSFGRSPDGGANWCYFDAATPNASNNASTCYAGYETTPVFSVQGGKYSAAISVQISTTSPTGVVRYTTNGNTPTPFSPLAGAPINIGSTKVISARTFSTTNNLPSPVANNTYFINESFSLQVFSITTDSSSLWDWNTGIYVMGPNADTAYPHYGANYWQDWEKTAQVEYFDGQQVKKFESATGLKIFGGYSRVFPQKSLKLKFRKHYGMAKMPLTVIPEKPFVKSYEDVILRNGGSDNYATHFRDAFMQRLMRSTHTDYMAYEPAMVFVNGEFWGFYETREKQDEKYIENNHGVSSKKIDFLSHEGNLYTHSGSDTGFYNMYNYLMTASPLDAGYYPRASKMLDLENFTDYFIGETYYGNKDWVGDWVNNIKLWRPQEGPGKWRYILWDVDWGMGLFSNANVNYLNRARYPAVPNFHSDMFNELLTNIEYRNYFVNRYADIINTVYQQDNVASLLYSMRDEVAPYMERHFLKWGGSVFGWHQEIQKVLDFNATRINTARAHIQNEFALPQQVNVELDVIPANAGKIKISTIIPDSLPWAGIYFDGVPVTITAIPNPGFTFKSWSGNSLMPESSSSSITMNISSSDKFVANFETNDIGLVAYPNPAESDVALTFTLEQDSEVSVRVFNVLGAEVMSFQPAGSYTKGSHTINLSLDQKSITRGMYVIQLNTADGRKSLKLVKK